MSKVAEYWDPGLEIRATDCPKKQYQLYLNFLRFHDLYENLEDELCEITLEDFEDYIEELKERERGKQAMHLTDF